jgi:hypothetical protein
MSLSPTPSARQLRKAAVQSVRVTVVLAEQVRGLAGDIELLGEILISRGFFGRLKWLLTGK